MSPAAPTPPAVASFLRGVERRAALLAELQCGDPAAGDAALGATMRAFRQAAPRQAMAQWPRAFWALLLATPQLRRTPAGVAATAWRPLAMLGNGTRAALLLRSLAGLEPEEAAAVLGVSPAACREAVSRALQRTANGRPQADTWADWEATFRHGLKSLPAARLAQLARLRELALAGVPAERGRSAFAPSPTGVPARGRALAFAWAGVALCAAGLLASFVRPDWFPGDGPREATIRTEALGDPELPASRFDAELGAWSHGDFDLLADPDGLREAQRLPLLAWYAAQLAVQATTPAATVDAALPAPEASPASGDVAGPAVSLPASVGQGPVPAAAEAAISRLPAAAQPAMRAQVRRWAGWTPDQRRAYLLRQARWDAQLPAARGEQRERYLAWRALAPAARSQIADAARALAALPAEQQEGLRTRFIAQDGSAQRGWLLGPVPGASYPKLQPLVAQLPPEQHAALLGVLRRLSPAENADLARLAQRTPPQERAALLRALLSTAESSRAAWLQARAAQ